MSELFRNAFSSALGWGGGSTEGRGSPSNVGQDNPFVGQTVDVKGKRIRIERVLAEGGFGFVFKVRDLESSQSLALKRLIVADKETKEEVENEIRVLQMLQPHPHVMKFINFGIIQGNTYLLLTEFCGCGSLVDIKLPINNSLQISKIMYQTGLAVLQMHCLNLIHRDLKIENILFDNQGMVKLCDFGSTTDKSYFPDIDWTPIQRSLVEDEMQRKTTPMYRPPEILDTYLHLPITTSMDVWSFGCMLYMIKFGRHPFEDSAKLRIINCNYSIPNDVSIDDIHVQIIQSSLKVDPRERTTISDIVDLLERNFVDLKSPVVRPKTPSPEHPQTPTNPAPQQIGAPSAPPVIPGSAAAAQPGAGIPSSLSGFTKYLKDTSTKVMQSVHNSIGRQDLDVTFLTSRLLVMSFPAEGIESAYRNHVDDVREFLEYPTKQPYAVVNVSGRSYGTSKFGPNVKVFDGGVQWKDTKHPPTLASVVTLCDSAYKWLKGDTRRILVVHCLDGKVNSAFFSAAFFLWIGLFSDWRSAHNLFAVRRTSVDWSPSHKRYLSYLATVGGGRCRPNVFPNSECAVIHAVVLNGVPLFTKVRDGCRPFLEIFMNGDMRIMSTCTDYERLRQYNRATDSRIYWKDLKATTDGKADLTIVVSHARSSLGSRVLTTKQLTAIKMMSLHINLDFERNTELGTQTLRFDINQLDGLEEADRFPRDFSVIVEVEFQGRSLGDTEFPSSVSDPSCLFEGESEFEEFKENFPNVNPHFHASSETEHPPVRPERHRPSRLPPKPSGNGQGSTVPSRPAPPPPSKSVPSDNLLNLSLDESSPVDPLDPLASSRVPSSNFEPIQPRERTGSLDLLGGSLPNSPSVSNAEASSSHSTGIDLLQDIFANSTGSAASQAASSSTGSGLNSQHGHKSSSSSLQRNTSTPNLATASKIPADPMKLLDDLTNKPSSSSVLRPGAAPLKPVPVAQNMPKPASYSSLNQATTTKNSFPPPKHQPHYSRSFFSEASAPPTTSNTGIGQKVDPNHFEDLLQGFSKTHDTSNMSMSQMKKAEMLKNGSIDPMKLKVLEWKENKTRNIRALLQSLDAIVWEGCKWKPVGMHQLVEASDVRKHYLRACLAVHPDKLRGDKNEELATLIFVELNDAWSEFEKQNRL